MMTILDEKNLSQLETGIDLENILVEVFSEKNSSSTSSLSSTSSSFAKYLFTEINKAEPVKLVDMPGIAKSAERKMINNAAAHLENSYRDMFKPSQRCRAPHLNVDNLRDALFTADVLSRHSITNEEELVNWIMDQNKELGEKYKNQKSKKGKGGKTAFEVSQTALDKAIKFDFYLGLESTWLYK